MTDEVQKQHIMSVRRIPSSQPYILEFVYLYIYFMFYLRILPAAPTAICRMGAITVNYKSKGIWRNSPYRTMK